MYSNKKVINVFNAFVLAILIVSCRSESAESLFPANGAAVELYDTQLSAILQEKCISCHTGFHADSYGDFNATVAGLSAIIARVNATDNLIMPPSGQVPLTDEELAVL